MARMSNEPNNPYHGGQTTVAPVAAPVAAITPEFLRFPRPGEKEPYSGLRRSQLYNLVDEGLIKVVSLRRRGKLRGTTLIVADSLRAYLRRLVAEQHPQWEAAKLYGEGESAANTGQPSPVLTASPVVNP